MDDSTRESHARQPPGRIWIQGASRKTEILAEAPGLGWAWARQPDREVYSSYSGSDATKNCHEEKTKDGMEEDDLDGWIVLVCVLETDSLDRLMPSVVALLDNGRLVERPVIFFLAISACQVMSARGQTEAETEGRRASEHRAVASPLGKQQLIADREDEERGACESWSRCRPLSTAARLALVQA